MSDSSDPRSAPGHALTVTDPADTALDAAARAYDPADYRWVPVRRRPRLDGWTEEKQRRFIEELADTGLVSVAAKAVGMTRESAYRLRRAAHGSAFARAWDVARQHAGALIEDIAFERAIEGVEQEVYNQNGEVVAARLVYDSGLLKWLLSHIKPERYGGGGAVPATAPALEESLRAMEPALPAPPEQLMPPEELEDALDLADAADGTLPHFLNEQRTPEAIADRDVEARKARGAAALAKSKAGQELTEEEFLDECWYLDPASNKGRRRRP
ncbi:hypothetical protein [Sphingomonas immobilis]|uniref:Terminase small subunit n=1 Tax=Sphingomonas immobilis TaxID=3063997 RepID=A0ABT8ZVN4_9SPHN|nr:hypothetical protein [Sphingomonas sp. CA1-15]MDO7841633.1 hypothetical protein [Sphingomonas sp. CA1-15]